MWYSDVWDTREQDEFDRVYGGPEGSQSVRFPVSPAPLPAPLSRFRKFLYDVGVNVVASLVTAAVIYVTAVAAGYISKNHLVLAFSLLVVGLAAAAAFTALVPWLTRKVGGRIQSAAERLLLPAAMFLYLAWAGSVITALSGHAWYRWPWHLFESGYWNLRH